MARRIAWFSFIRWGDRGDHFGGIPGVFLGEGGDLQGGWASGPQETPQETNPETPWDPGDVLVGEYRMIDDLKDDHREKTVKSSC